MLVVTLVGAINLVFAGDLIVAKSLAELQKQDITAEQIEQTMPIIELSIWGMTLAAPLFLLIIAAVVHLITGVFMKGAGGFVGSLAVTSYAMVVGIVEALVRTPLALAKGTIDVFLGPAALLPASMAGTPVFQILAQFDVFAIWKVVLVGLGLEPRPPHPKGYELEPGNLDALERVRARGKLYREA